jgi:ketosteroid isomerase-like protein
MKYLLSVALVALSATCVLADDKAAIEKWNRSFEEAMAKRDAQSLANLYDENATVLPDKSPLFQGRDKVAAYWAEGVKIVSDLKLNTVSVTSFGSDTVQSVGTMTYKVTMPGEQPKEFNSKYLTIFRKNGEDVKAITDMWNDDK